MGSLAPILNMFVPNNCSLVAAGEDLKDYYYSYIISSTRSKRNALAMHLSRAEAKKFRNAYRGAPREAEVLIPALATMAMGDLNSVEFGQQAHVRLGLQHVLVRLQDFMTMRGAFPRQHWAVGCVIDDFIVLESTPHGTPSSELVSLVGLESNPKKRFRAETNPQFWGISIDGASALVRAQLDRVIPLAFISARIARAGAAPRHLLEVVAGAWTAIIQARKRCMCLLDTIFEEIQRYPYGQVFEISHKLAAELLTLTVIAPLMVSDLHATAAEQLYTVDASDDRAAGVVAYLPGPIAQELHRHVMTRAAWSRLLSPWKGFLRGKGALEPEEEVPLGEEPAKAHPLWVQLARTCKFEVLFNRRAAAHKHINVKELRALLTVEKQHAEQHPSTRVGVGTDSQVCLGAVVKGRSSSFILNDMLLSHLPTLLVYNCYTGHQYLPSAENPSDDPTRLRELRLPSESAPSWLEKAFDGDFDEFDQFLKEHHVNLEVLARLPSFEEEEVPASWLASGRELRRKLFDFQQRSLHHGKHSSGGATLKAERKMARDTAETSAPLLWKADCFPPLSPDAERALRKLPASHFVFPRAWTAKQRRESLQRSGALDLFSGSRGLARSLARHAGTWALTFDIAHDPKQDLLAASVQTQIEQLVALGCFRVMTAGPVCSSFSRAVRPPVRSREHPSGLPGLTMNMQRKVLDGNTFSHWLALLVERCFSAGMLVVVENPWLSFLWDQAEWQRLTQVESCGYFTTDDCRWGMPWRKRTRFFTNRSLRGNKVLCQCQRPVSHVRLSGYSAKHKVPWTKVAESYPVKLCNALAVFLANDLLPVERRRKLDIAACARCNARLAKHKSLGPDLGDCALLSTWSKCRCSHLRRFLFSKEFVPCLLLGWKTS